MPFFSVEHKTKDFVERWELNKYLKISSFMLFLVDYPLKLSS